MKFKAWVDYNLLQAREAKKFGDKNIAGDGIDFTFQDIVGYEAQINGKILFFPPSFTARELIIPWLQKGNLPIVIEDIT